MKDLSISYLNPIIKNALPTPVTHMPSSSSSLQASSSPIRYLLPSTPMRTNPYTTLLPLNSAHHAFRTPVQQHNPHPIYYYPAYTPYYQHFPSTPSNQSMLPPQYIPSPATSSSPYPYMYPYPAFNSNFRPPPPAG